MSLGPPKREPDCILWLFPPNKDWELPYLDVLRAEACKDELKLKSLAPELSSLGLSLPSLIVFDVVKVVGTMTPLLS